MLGNSKEYFHFRHQYKEHLEQNAVHLPLHEMGSIDKFLDLIVLCGLVIGQFQFKDNEN